MPLSTETARSSPLPRHEAAFLKRDGKCRSCGDPTEACRNCFGTKVKRRDGRMCRACNGEGVKAFCPDPDCRRRFYAQKKAEKRPKRSAVALLHPPQPIAASGAA